MINRKPEGYKDLLVYKKSAEVQELTLRLTILFPKSFAWLKEQMDKSGRSGTKNIIEGWKRNSTGEYFNFLGFSIGAIEELKDDAADIAKGLYQPLMGIKGLMGSNGGNGPFTPFQPFSSFQPITPPQPITPQPFKPFPPSSSIQPINPFQPFSPVQLESLKFYPLDTSFPPMVQLYLKCKEVLMLLNKLQQSLDHKMDEDKTRSTAELSRRRIKQFDQENRAVEKDIEKLGLIRLENGSFVKKGSNEDNGSKV